MIYLEYLITIVGIYLSVYVLYSIMLIIVHFLIKEKEYPMLKPETRFGIVVPAHNEELLLALLLESINNQSYPSERFKTFVIADNCTDDTAQVGRENGAIVMERTDKHNKGKGHAIKWAIEQIDLNEYDAIFIMDADGSVNEDVLMQLDQNITEGKDIIQCNNAISNPDDSWFTRLQDISRTVGNEMYHRSKEYLGLSSHLVGNGMCFSTNVLKEYGWDAFTVGEDWEYYAKLIKNGKRVAYAYNAHVFQRESSSIKQATSQRMRWSSGRFAIVWQYGFGLFYRGLVERNLIKLDASLPLIFPNPSLGVNITVLFFILSFPLMITDGTICFVLWFLCLMMAQLLIFITGIMYTENKLKKFLAIFIAPLFLVWKMGIDILSVLGIGRKNWVRTERKL